MKTNVLILITVMSFFTTAFSQNNPVKIPVIGEQFPEFTLPVYQGGEFSTSNLNGKTLLLISSRGKYAEGHWCAICNYQYADFATIAMNDSIREKYNLEIVFLMPYSKDTLTEWEKAFPKELKKIENWKNPPVTDGLTPQQIAWAEYTNKKFPKTFTYDNSSVSLPLPILMDGNKEVSKGFDIYRTEWDGGKGEQNIPAVYIVGKDGILLYKYVSQNTFDRPSSEYIINFIDKVIPNE